MRVIVIIILFLIINSNINYSSKDDNVAKRKERVGAIAVSACSIIIIILTK